MVSGASSEKINQDKQKVLMQLSKLAETAELLEIRQAAHYIEINISERTTKKSLLQLRAEVSKLIDSVSDHEQVTTFEQVVCDLCRILPDSVPRQIQPSLLYQYSAEPLLDYRSGERDSASSSPERDDESTSLLEQRPSTRHWYGSIAKMRR